MIFWTFSGPIANGQCDPPELLPTLQCGDAPEVCLQNACYSTQPINEVGHTGFCGPNTIINNPQYFAFTTISETVNIQIEVTGCSGGNNALQAALLSTCEWDNDDVLACNAGTGVGGTMFLNASNLTIGAVYYLLIDGSDGALCEYEITGVTGTFEPGITEELTEINGDMTACQGQDLFTLNTGPAISNAAGYLWDMPWGIETSTLTTLEVEVPVDAPVGPYEVCVLAFSGCDTSDVPQCMTIEITAVDDEDAPPVFLCPEDLPYTWHSNVISGPGMYTQEFNTPEGCPYDSILEVTVYPDVEIGNIDTVVCGDIFTYENVDYYEDGTYPLEYPGLSATGCDSSANLNLILAEVDAEIIFECQGGSFVMGPLISFQNPSDATLNYQWTNDVGDQLCDLPECIVDDPGVYHLDISMTVNGTTCVYPATSLTINLEDVVPPAPVLILADSVVCEDAVLEYHIDTDFEVGPIIEYIWSVPTGATVLDPGSPVTEIAWGASSGGEVCVRAVNECGEGFDRCFTVEVISTPDLQFDIPDSLCIGEEILVEFLGSASQDAEIYWKFDNAVINDTTGEGPHSVSWPSSGDKTITLQVIEPGCDTVSLERTLSVSSLDQPVVNCNSTITDVTFTWDAVPGAQNYSVDVLQGSTGMLDGNSYTISNLSPGDTVVIEVSAENTICGIQSTLAECIAQNCNAQPITLETADSICLEGSTGIFDFIATINDIPVNGVWSGTGIVDQDSGFYDPAAMGAGAGQHQITFVYTDSLGCVSNAAATVHVFDQPESGFSLDSAICISDFALANYTGSAGPNATYTWGFGDGNALQSGGGENYEITWDGPGIKEVRLTVEENGCVSDETVQAVEVKPLLEEPLFSCSPTTSEVTISWEEAQGQSYQPTVLSGQGGMLTGSDYYFDNLNPGDIVTIELVVTGDGVCPQIVDTFSCVARACPPVELAIDSVAPVCLVQGTPEIAMNVVVTNGNGSGYWTGPGVDSSGIFDPVDAGPGNHLIRYNYEDDGCPFSDQMRIEVFETPVAQITGDDLLTCENNNRVALDGSGSTGTNLMYTWSTASGVLLSPVDSTGAVAGGPGMYQLLVTSADGFCSDSTTFEVFQDDNIPVADAGEDQVLDCNSPSVTLSGNSSSGSTIVYQWTSTDGNILTDPSAENITVDAAGTYQIMVLDTSNGCESVDVVAVAIDTIAPVAQESVSGILDCDTKEVDIEVDVSPAGNTYGFSWATNDGNILSDPTARDVTVDLPGIYTLTVENLDNGCQTALVTEVFADGNLITGLDVIVQDMICYGDDDGAIAILDYEGGTPPYSVNWTTGSQDEMLSGLPPGTYGVEVVDANGCTFTKEYMITEPEALTASLGDDLSINRGDTVTLSITGNFEEGMIDSVLWEGISTSCHNCLSLTYSGIASQFVQATVIDTNGCVAMTQVFIEVEMPENMFIPNVFTPNGDGANDFFTIYGSEHIALVEQLQIFSRWGELVYQQSDFPPNNPEVGWNGNINEKEANKGVYLYHAVLLLDDGRRESVSGDVTLVR